VAKRLGAFDSPGGERKLQARPVPVLGGVGIFLGYAAGLGLAWMLGGGAAPWRGTALEPIFWTSLVILAVGVVDDLRDLSPWPKLAVQVGAALILFTFGVRGTFLVPSAIVSVAATVVWLVMITNAYNFFDNMDGLCAGMGVVSGAVFLAVCLSTGQWAVAVALAALVGACASFLVFNWHPASIYMGDCGALWLGYTIASLIIATTFYHYERSVLQLALPPLVVAVPLFDMALVLLVRLKLGRPLTRGDRIHLSHRLVALGMKETEAVLTILLLASALGLGAYLLKDLSPTGGIVVLAQAAAVMCVVFLLEWAGRRAD
jgi:UDP-GlcNAc:undecaprenyl-phosphate GlcNAc-1-phosphate transferase